MMSKIRGLGSTKELRKPLEGRTAHAGEHHMVGLAALRAIHRHHANAGSELLRQRLQRALQQPRLVLVHPEPGEINSLLQLRG